MPFCIKCGQKLATDAKFCHSCGYPTVTIESANTDSIVGKQLKCPNCGGAIDAISAVCPFCGIVFSGRNSNTNTVRELVFMLDEIEAENSKSLNSIKNRIFIEAFGKDEITESKLKRKIELIRNFPIPNSIEEITEFMLLADSNIDVKLSKNTFFHKFQQWGNDSREPEAKLSDVWVEKMRSTYKKAEMVFSSMPQFSTIHKLYVEKMAALKILV